MFNILTSKINYLDDFTLIHITTTCIHCILHLYQATLRTSCAVCVPGRAHRLREILLHLNKLSLLCYQIDPPLSRETISSLSHPFSLSRELKLPLEREDPFSLSRDTEVKQYGYNVKNESCRALTAAKTE